MLRAIWVVSRESLVLLRRDRIFLPVLLAALLFTGLAHMVSMWSVENFQKILFDFGLFMFQLLGSLVAIIWSTKAVADSRQEGSLEVQLAAPISRSSWLIGKYLGLCTALVLLAIPLVTAWQALMLIYGYGWMTAMQRLAFAFLLLSWFLVGALGLLFSAVVKQTIAMFATICAWVCGLASASIASSLSPDTPEGTKKTLGLMARFWDFQQLNLADHLRPETQLPLGQLIDRACYGALLAVVLLTLGCLLFSQRDLSA